MIDLDDIVESMLDSNNLRSSLLNYLHGDITVYQLCKRLENLEEMVRRDLEYRNNEECRVVPSESDE